MSVKWWYRSDGLKTANPDGKSFFWPSPYLDVHLLIQDRIQPVIPPSLYRYDGDTEAFYAKTKNSARAKIDHNDVIAWAYYEPEE